ncbi:hypothetical protein BD324DRAFT_648311 [Kockovaella imperatae]|uniref:F-box domain-containing protein n=1 Tax=Kockovaella imperatae TaxID=4999 RepID=A0A1Y1UNQ6_9TREE|nr:hypothetical protein BD324DRAFT_648311 [Kockovaella imperatae]ORX39678.1 hypothetical protein BD324DRAFT_648311 [Kockovaella imperatae]
MITDDTGQHLQTLPDDVLSHLLRYLDLEELLRLQQVNRQLRERVITLGLPQYLVRHAQNHVTLCPQQDSWKPYDLVRRNLTILQNLKARQWHALQIGPTWQSPVIPTLTLTPSMLLLGVGGKLLVHPLHDWPTSGGKVVGRAKEHLIASKGTGSGADIIGVAPLVDDGSAFTVAQFDGTLQTYTYENSGLRPGTRWRHADGANVHTLSASSKGDLMLTSTSAGVVSIFSPTSPRGPLEAFSLPTSARAWSSLVATSHASLDPSIMVGVHGGILIYPMSPTGVVNTPRKLLGPDKPSRSSPYCLTFPSKPSVHHPSLLLSAWYDSHLRIHDLRSPDISPQMEFADPWQWADASAMYCATYFAENHIAGGGSRHGTVSLFDIRQPKAGWSIFTPGGKGSPVYALQGEGGRLWGVTERRAFALSFDGSGGIPAGLVASNARAPRTDVRHTPSGWKGRGGKWRWTVRYNESADVCTGYNHSERGVNLFESLAAA